MATKQVTYCTSYKPDCAFTPNADVILCLKDSALVIQPEPPCGLELTTVLATICGAVRYDNGCQNFIYQYTFSYDDEQITEPDTRPLLDSDIDSFLCQDCLIDYIQQQISCIGAINCVESSDTLTLEINKDGCLIGEVTGGGGSVVPYYLNTCVQAVTSGALETVLKSVSFDSDLFDTCGQRIEFQITGQWFTLPAEIATLTVTFGGEILLTQEFDADTSGQWFFNGYFARSFHETVNWVCFGSNSDLKLRVNDDPASSYPATNNSSISLPFPATFDFEVVGQGQSADSYIQLNQLVIDYYDTPTICEGENDCCD